MKEAYLIPNPMTPTQVVVINYELCNGCNECVNICRTQTIMPNPEKDKPPVVIYPDECWFCGSCVEVCPAEAILLRHPLNQSVGWKNKISGKNFRLGMKNPPAQTYHKPAFG